MMSFFIQSYDMVYLVSLSNLVSHRKSRCELGKESSFGWVVVFVDRGKYRRYDPYV
jgi:hypothetical protein